MPSAGLLPDGSRGQGSRPNGCLQVRTEQPRDGQTRPGKNETTTDQARPGEGGQNRPGHI